MFMDSLFKKVYAAVCSSDAKTPYIWYIPCHGIYHPNKPDKITTGVSVKASDCRFLLTIEPQIT